VVGKRLELQALQVRKALAVLARARRRGEEAAKA
jgi:hypothetical protein